MSIKCSILYNTKLFSLTLYKVSNFLFISLMLISITHTNSIFTRIDNIETSNCSYFYSLNQSIDQIKKPNQYNLLIISSSNEKEFLPLAKISNGLSRLDKPIKIDYQCHGNTYNTKTIFSLLFEEKIILLKELQNYLNMDDCIDNMLKEIALAQLEYLVFQSVDDKFIDPSLYLELNFKNKLAPTKILSTNDKPIFIQESYTKLSNKYSISLIQIQPNLNSNSTNSTISSNSSSSVQLVYVSQNSVPNKGLRFLYVMLIVIACISSILVLIYFSLQFGNSSRSEINRLKDNDRKIVLSKIRHVNFSLNKVDLNY